MIKFHTYEEFCKSFYLIPGVYNIQNTTTNKNYIGESTNVTQRVNSHFKNLASNSHNNKQLQEDYNLYGKESFQIALMAEIANDVDRVTKEQEIAQHFINEGIPMYSSFLHNSKSKSVSLVNNEQIKEICQLRKLKHTWTQIQQLMNEKHNFNYSWGWYAYQYRYATTILITKADCPHHGTQRHHCNKFQCLLSCLECEKLTAYLSTH